MRTQTFRVFEKLEGLETTDIMRFQLTLELMNPEERMFPINYQYELSSWIYKVIHFGNPEFARWLHESGFMNDRKQFRLFTFSNLIIPEKNVNGDRLIIRSPTIYLYISILPLETISHFISGLFRNQEFRLGDRESQVPFRVITVEGIPKPDFHNTMSFTALSPLLISIKKPEDRYARYLSPDQPEYSFLFFRNLKEKWKAFSGKPYDTGESEERLTITSPIKKKGILIKAGTPMESKLIGYQFDFFLDAPAELIRIGYYTGFGEKNSVGFGCVGIK